MNQPTQNPIYACILLLVIFTSSAYAQIASWNPAGLTAYGPSPWAPTTTATGVTVGGLTRGAGLATTGSPITNAWGAVNWAGAANQDATFTVTANPGYTVSFSVFNLSYRRSNTGPNAGTLEYTFGSSSTYTVIGTLASLTSTATTATAITPVNLSGVADLQNVPPGTVVKFRIFPTGGTSVGTFYIYGSAGMSLGGTVLSSALTSSITQTAPVLCHGQAGATLSVSATGGTLPYTYSWSPSGGNSAVASGLTAGIYTCVVTSASSATTMSTYTVTEPSALVSGISTQSAVSCFNGSNGAATFTVSGGTPSYTYSWAPTGGTALNAANLSAGNYTLTVTDANSCTVSGTVTIVQPSPLSLTVSPVSPSVCIGSSLSLTATGATTYTWSNGVTNGVAFTPTSTANYTVSGTNANGCTGTASVSVVVNALPVVSTSVSPSATVCAGSPVTLSGSGAATYTWTGGVSNGIPFTPATSASYTVTGTAANGCTNTAVRPLTVNALPALGASTSNATLCVGQTATLTAFGAASYTWNAGQQTAAIAVSPTATTTYTVRGSNAAGCIGSIPVTQIVSPCTGIEQLSASGTEIRFYPNPNQGSFTVSAKADIELQIVNDLGELVRSMALSSYNDRQVRIEGLAQGVYFLLSPSDPKSRAQKIMVAP